MPTNQPSLSNMTSKPKAPQTFLKNFIYQDLFRRIELHDRLLRQVKEGLPVALARQCLYCVAREDGGLVIFSDSQAVASQLRFYAPVILAQLNADREKPFKQVVVRNLPADEPKPTVKPMKVASPEAIAAVKASSMDAAGDELAIALAKLAATMERHAKENS
ncbi:MAG: DciA family protein [Candidatus Methylumidiphilus sp.]